LNIIFYIIVFILGSAVGSFLSVLLFRTKKNLKGIVWGRSKCPFCKHKLKTKDLIPIFSNIFLGGKCGYCKHKIPTHYLMIEIFTAALFLVTFLIYPFVSISPIALTVNFSVSFLLYFLFYAVIISFLMLIAFYDYLYQEIPDKFSFPLFIVVLIFTIIRPDITYVNAGLGLIVPLAFFGAQYFISKGKWIGGGDLRLGPIVGLLLGWPLVLIALIISYVSGSFYGIYVLVKNKFKRNIKIAFGPFIILGTIITFIYGQLILDYYFKLLGY